MLFSSFWKRGPGPPLWGPGGVLGPLDPPPGSAPELRCHTHPHHLDTVYWIPGSNNMIKGLMKVPRESRKRHQNIKTKLTQMIWMLSLSTWWVIWKSTCAETEISHGFDAAFWETGAREFEKFNKGYIWWTEKFWGQALSHTRRIQTITELNRRKQW